MNTNQLLEAIKGYGEDQRVITIGLLKAIIQEIIDKENKIKYLNSIQRGT